MKRTMAWVEKRDTLGFRESALPTLAEDAVLLRTAYSAICGSDLHLYHDAHPFVKAPAAIGHELSGYVEAVGAGVTAVKPGDLVVPEPILTCGVCGECLRGDYHMCRDVSFGYRRGPSGFGDYYICRERWAHRLPEGTDPRAAALVEPLSVAIHGVEKAGELLGRTVTVLGAGAIGAFAAKVCTLKGAARVFLVDTNAYRLSAAASPVAGCVPLNPKECDPVREICAATGGGSDVVVECTGNPVCIRQAVALACKMGTIVQLGICSRAVSGYDYPALLSKELTLRGSQGYRFDFEKAVGLVGTGRLRLENYISHTFPFSRLREAFALAAAPATPSMKIIALDLETITSTQLFDRLVVVTTCDKTIPGVLLGAARLDMPTMVVPGGIMDTGLVDGREVSLADLDEKVFSGSIQSMGDEEAARWEDGVIPGDGACPIMGTANTMQSLLEVLGLSLPFSSTKMANTAAQARLAKVAGRRIAALVRDNTRFSDIVIPAAMENMLKGAMAIGAASNSILHMLALSHEMGFEDRINVGYIAGISRKIPCIVDVKPVGDQYLTKLERAGGIPAIMSKLTGVLDASLVGVSGKTVGEICREGALAYAGGTVIRELDDPVMENGGIIVLRGNLGSSAIVRAFRHSKDRFRGRAKVFHSQQEAVAAVASGSVVTGDALVLRFMGPRGGPGMPDCFGVAAAVVGAGLEETVAVVTDGRFSGFARGVGVCQLCPEAATGGPLAKVRDGDPILIDTQAGVISDEAPDFASRRPEPAPERREKGILRIYAQMAGEAATGARL